MDICLEKYSDVICMEKRMRELEGDMTEYSGDDEKLSEIYKEYGEIQERFDEKNGYGFMSEIKGCIYQRWDLISWNL